MALPPDSRLREPGGRGTRTRISPGPPPGDRGEPVMAPRFAHLGFVQLDRPLVHLPGP